MAVHAVFFSFTLTLLCFLNVTLSEELTESKHLRFEYKMSFKGPHLVQRDGTIPFWEHSGHAIASEDSVRITPSLKSKKGQIWAKIQNTNEHWVVDLVFKVTGRGRVGADGLAFWYTREKGVEGPVFGSNDNWNGLGIFLDSFDNDGQHNNPYIMGMVNDGTKSYDHESDGQINSIGGCLRDYRNKPNPIKLKIEYYKKALTISIDNGLGANDMFDLCMRAENVELPTSGYFGVTAATGGLADDHDVLSFITHSITTNVKVNTQVTEDEKQKFQKEFDEYWDKLQKAKENYQKDHPDKKPHADTKPEDYFESQDLRELKQIFDGQNSIHETLRVLHRKMDETIGRQERTLSQITLMSQQGGTGAQAGGGGAAPAYVDTIKRHEVEEVLRHNRELSNTMNEFRQILNTIQSQKNVGGTGAAGNVYEDQQKLVQLQETIHSLQADIKSLTSRPNLNAQGCPNQTNCASTATIFVLIFLQMIVYLGYHLYRANKEAAAKKLY